MCGIIAVVRRPSLRTAPTRDDVMALVDGTAAVLEGVALAAADAPLIAVADRLETADRLLRGTPGIRAMLADPGLGDALRVELGSLHTILDLKDKLIILLQAHVRVVAIFGCRDLL